MADDDVDDHMPYVVVATTNTLTNRASRRQNIMLIRMTVTMKMTKTMARLCRRPTRRKPGRPIMKLEVKNPPRIKVKGAHPEYLALANARSKIMRKL